MLYVLPDYYPEFRCIAGECEDTCCAGWQIMIDRSSLRKYRKWKGPYRWNLLGKVDWIHGAFRRDKQNRCAFLNEENLCEMYKNMGEGALCRTCKLFPRHIEEYENVREVSLSISCPEAARILFARQEPVRFREFEREEADDETYPDFDELFFSQLTMTRGDMIEILQNRELDIPLRAALMTGIGADLQKRFDEGNLFAFSDVTDRAKSDRGIRTAASKLAASREELFDWISDMMKELEEFEILRAEWPAWLDEVQTMLYRSGKDVYHSLEREFKAWMERDERDWDIVWEQLLVYFLFSYYCGAVYDGKILASAQMAVAYTWILRDMLMAQWERNGHQLDTEDLVDMAVRYTRELEHSDVNQKKMEYLMTEKRLPWLC